MKHPDNPQRKWQTKIVGHDRVDPATLTPHPLNWRTHPEEQDAVVRASIAEHGVVKSILVNRTTGHVLDGHERLALALADDEPLVDVEYAEVPPEQEAAVLMSLDPTSAMAGIDADNLTALIEQANPDREELQKLFDDLAAEANDELGDLIDKASGKISEQEVLPPIERVWVLAGIPAQAYGEVAAHFQAIRETDGVVWEQATK